MKQIKLVIVLNSALLDKLISCFLKICSKIIQRKLVQRINWLKRSRKCLKLAYNLHKLSTLHSYGLKRTTT